MSIKEARNILAEDALSLSDNEVNEIIDWLNMMADLFIDVVEKESV